MQEAIQKILQKDPFLLREARGVAFPRYWYELSGNGEVLWGQYRSKRSKCQTTVDLRHEKIAFQCDCRSRKNPCKHGLALIILMLEYNEAFKVVTEIPEEVQQWLKRRDQRILPKEHSKEELAILEEKRQKTRAKRLHQMSRGLEELEIWLHDSMREGLATLHHQPKSYWKDWATRLVDAKMKGIAVRFEQIPNLLKSEHWEASLLAELANIYLIIRGFRNINTLSEALQQELFNTIGVNVKKEEVLLNEGINDQWSVLAIEEGQEERLYFQRCWLYGKKSKQFALYLDFAWGTEPFSIEWKVGSVVEGDLVYYPSSYPQRGIFRSFQLTQELLSIEACSDFQQLQQLYASAVSANPWLFNFPNYIENVIPFIEEETLFLIDIQRNKLPIKTATEQRKWQIFALSGGHPIEVFGTWNGTHFLILAAQKEKRWIDLSIRQERKNARRW